MGTWRLVRGEGVLVGPGSAAGLVGRPVSTAGEAEWGGGGCKNSTSSTPQEWLGCEHVQAVNVCRHSIG